MQHQDKITPRMAKQSTRSPGKTRSTASGIGIPAIVAYAPRRGHGATRASMIAPVPERA